jgi:hypothetical protein
MNYELFATRAEQGIFAFCRDENSNVKEKTRSTPKIPTTPKTPM